MFAEKQIVLCSMQLARLFLHSKNRRVGGTVTCCTVCLHSPTFMEVQKPVLSAFSQRTDLVLECSFYRRLKKRPQSTEDWQLHLVTASDMQKR